MINKNVSADATMELLDYFIGMAKKDLEESKNDLKNSDDLSELVGIAGNISYNSGYLDAMEFIKLHFTRLLES